MFTTHKYQCATSRYAPVVEQMIQQGLASAQAFLESLISSYDDYWHDVGVMTHIRVLYADLAKITKYGTSAKCVGNIGLRNRTCPVWIVLMLPRLSLARWPHSGNFGYITRTWPAAKEMRRQCKVLWHKVHTNSDRRDWQPLQCVVCLAQPPSMLLTTLGRRLHETRGRRFYPGPGFNLCRLPHFHFSLAEPMQKLSCPSKLSCSAA